MLPHALEFSLSDRLRDVVVLLPHQQLAVRHTLTTLEFLWPNGKSTAVVCVEGMHLGILLRDILRGATTNIRLGAYGPPWARCHVTSIHHRLGWSRPKRKMALNPNPISPQYLEMETGTSRDIWSRSHLAGFAVPRGPAEKFLFQFLDSHAYVLDTEPETFEPRLNAFLAANFTLAMTNRLSVFTRTPYGRCVPDVPRSSFASIVHEEKNLASKGEWNVIMDFRGQSITPRPSLQID